MVERYPDELPIVVRVPLPEQGRLAVARRRDDHRDRRMRTRREPAQKPRATDDRRPCETWVARDERLRAVCIQVELPLERPDPDSLSGRALSWTSRVSHTAATRPGRRAGPRSDADVRLDLLALGLRRPALLLQRLAGGVDVVGQRL